MTRKLFFTVLACLFLCLSVCAENFYIKNYDVDLKVGNTKNVHVTETIDAYFTRRSHGIFRDIPAPNAEITNIKVSEKNKVTSCEETYSIQIGDANKYVTGEHTYKISYDYKFFDNKNELYFNIIGTDWNTNINHVKFNIEMPQTIDDSKTGLSIGKRGTKGFSVGEGKYTVNGNIISGETLRPLQSREGVTIRIEVPKGYFVNNLASKQNISIYLMLLSTLACIIIWFIHGKDKNPIPVISFYPPEKMDVLDIELVYNEYASAKGVVGMIVNLAQKGYLKITYLKARKTNIYKAESFFNKFIDKKGIAGKIFNPVLRLFIKNTDKNDEFAIQKEREYDGDNEYEKTLINAIFEGNSKTATEQHLQKSRHFYKAVKKIVEEKNKLIQNLYEPEESYKPVRKVMQYIIGFLGLVLSFVCASYNPWNIFKGLIIVGLYLIAQWFIYLCIDEVRNKTLAAVTVNLILILPFYIGFLATFEAMNYVYPICLLGYFCILISTLCYFHMRKLNKQTLLTLGKLEGLKKFIKTAEVNRLQMLVDENPQYFYNILPYAYIFNLSDKWIKKFENIVKPNEAWSNGTAFKEKEFVYFMNTMNKFSEPSYENGGITYSSGGGSHHSSSGGGGYSGGGGGGGGGRSW